MKMKYRNSNLEIIFYNRQFPVTHRSKEKALIQSGNPVSGNHDLIICTILKATSRFPLCKDNLKSSDFYF